MITKKQPPQEPAPSEPDFLDNLNPEPQTAAVEKANPRKIRYICTRAERYGDKVFAPAEILEEEAGVKVPDAFMPMVLEGPEGTIETGPHFFCLKECSCHGRTFKPGDLWDVYAFQESAPAGLFAPLTERENFEFGAVGNIQRAELRQKPSEPPTTPTAQGETK